MCRSKTIPPFSCRISGSSTSCSAPSASTASASAPPSSCSGATAFGASSPASALSPLSFASVSCCGLGAVTSEMPSGSMQETRTSASAMPALTSTTRSAVSSPAFRLSVCGRSFALIFGPQSCTRGRAIRWPSTRSAPDSRRSASSSSANASSRIVIGKVSVTTDGSLPAAGTPTSPRIWRWTCAKPSGSSPSSTASAGRISSTGTFFSAMPALAISTV